MSTIVAKIRKSDILYFYLLNKKIHIPVLDAFMKLFTQLGSTVFAVLLSLAMLFYNRQMGIVLAGNLIASQLIIHLLKRIVNRPRPYKTLEWAMPINPPKCKYSLPSGHSGSALSIALALSTFFPALRIILISMAVLVGISRIYLGCHYPTDVTIGFVISYTIYKALDLLVFI